ncbi:HAD superfamily hydrolase (TIGR01509 family)/HAD superfamily hydrolase (TIGR01549 family) [Jatrophihabitans sp. GAS493]|uniref:HAD family hydrolase n=1 Tax=Jatrophihabitans sp. GAS493 TaxID=1907575 RepID=UPI000BB793ED|nr:HAD family hydrolase [Jatrophihabitans sp. GAS493]SOD73612.1 HAD superfamily hydrolase (TIGR01509 family)/HAD superfamily hydrolase (TIGR01549 family) [Jatrophihabitans sp. GAS493]
MSDDPVRGVLFDVDGTLVDTTYVHTLCWTYALGSRGHDCPMATVHRSIGMGSTELLDHLLGAGRDRGEDDLLSAAHLTLYRQYWGRLRPIPGALDLLRGCRRLGLRSVLASSASDEELAMLRSTLNADELLHESTSSDDAASGKPQPDILQAAMEQGRLTRDGVVFVGDSVWDAQAAARAGIAFIGLTCGGTSAAELLDAGAVEVWRDPLELTGHVEESRIYALAQD